MKNPVICAIFFTLITASCEKNETDVFLRIGNDLEYKFSDIELYDTSTHMLYFKEIHNELKEIENATFTFLDNGEQIYSGSFWPGYCSSRPVGPFVSSPLMFKDYFLEIENWFGDNEDIRNDARMIEVLNRHDLLHSGLAFSSYSVEITGTQLTFTFAITNHDKSDLLTLDIEKTGEGLFHYFTNGLTIRDLSYNVVFSSPVDVVVPDTWNSWQNEWLSVLQSGETSEYTIIYELDNPVIPGEYFISFSYPGLSYQVKRDQLFQGNSRIWLGDIILEERTEIGGR